MSDSGDLVCPSCGLSFPPTERFCGACAMPLTYAENETVEPAYDETHERARKIDPRYAEGELVRVAGGRHQAEAELIQGILLEEGVPSILRRSAGFDVPDFLAAGPRDVLVPESGAGLARAMLEGTDLAPQQAPPPQPGATTRLAAQLTAAVLGGGALAALIAWGLLQTVD